MSLADALRLLRCRCRARGESGSSSGSRGGGGRRCRDTAAKRAIRRRVTAVPLLRSCDGGGDGGWRYSGGGSTTRHTLVAAACSVPVSEREHQSAVCWRVPWRAFMRTTLAMLLAWTQARQPATCVRARELLGRTSRATCSTPPASRRAYALHAPSDVLPRLHQLISARR